MSGDAGSERSGFDDTLASLALALMALVPMIEIAMRPLLGRAIDNAPVLVQHLGLVMTMFGAVAAERNGHLTSLGAALGGWGGPSTRRAVRAAADAAAALVCGMLALASGRFVASEMAGGQLLAYGMPTWVVQATMPLGFALLGARLARRLSNEAFWRRALAVLLPLAGAGLALAFEGRAWPLMPGLVVVVWMLLAGAPIFSALGLLALWLFAGDGLPIASVPLSHYQITVNPSLPALPLFTLAGLVFARTGAAQRLGRVFIALFGEGVNGAVLATAAMCSAFTAFAGGSGVTILAIGGLLLPVLRQAGYPERRGIGLVTSASALGVLLAPSVPLIMYAVIARVPILDMYLAGLVPAVVMVGCLLTVGGFLQRPSRPHGEAVTPGGSPVRLFAAVRAAKWELAAPLVAIGSLASGLATPTESAAITAVYAVLTQAFGHRELDGATLRRCLRDGAQLIGGVMLILGMALALTNFLVNAGIPDAAVDWVRSMVPNRWLFLLLLCLFLFAAAALMEIYAALVVLVPLLLPLARSYDLDPVHFGVVFLAAMEVGFLCPPAGLNVYFASAMFGKSVRYVTASVLPALLAILTGTLIVAALPPLATALPRFLTAH